MHPRPEAPLEVPFAPEPAVLTTCTDLRWLFSPPGPLTEDAKSDILEVYVERKGRAPFNVVPDEHLDVAQGFSPLEPSRPDAHPTTLTDRQYQYMRRSNEGTVVGRATNLAIRLWPGGAFKAELNRRIDARIREQREQDRSQVDRTNGSRGPQPALSPVRNQEQSAALPVEGAHQGGDTMLAPGQQEQKPTPEQINSIARWGEQGKDIPAFLELEEKWTSQVNAAQQIERHTLFKQLPENSYNTFVERQGQADMLHGAYINKEALGDYIDRMVGEQSEDYQPFHNALTALREQYGKRGENGESLPPGRQEIERFLSQWQEIQAQVKQDLLELNVQDLTEMTVEAIRNWNYEGDHQNFVLLVEDRMMTLAAQRGWESVVKQMREVIEDMNHEGGRYLLWPIFRYADPSVAIAEDLFAILRDPNRLGVIRESAADTLVTLRRRSEVLQSLDHRLGALLVDTSIDLNARIALAVKLAQSGTSAINELKTLLSHPLLEPSLRENIRLYVQDI